MSCRFGGRSEDEQSFTIDPVSGVVRTKRRLDRETREHYELMVQAYDAGIPEMTSTVKVAVQVLGELYQSSGRIDKTEC